MRKSVSVYISNKIQPKRLSLEDRLYELLKTPKTASEIFNILNSESQSTIHPRLCQMIVKKKIESVICPHCRVGKIYRRIK